MTSAATYNASYLRRMPPERRQSFLDSLTDDEVIALRYDWLFWGRAEQRPPPGEWSIWMIMAGRGFGKLFYPEMEIFTHNRGWITFAGIRAGDMVFDEQGMPCRVTATHTPPLDQIGQTYRLHFSDGTTLDTCADHQWVTWTHRDRKAFNRSQYENVSWPEDWVNWRPSRLIGHGSRLRRDVIEQALEIYADCGSMRETARIMGCARQALSQHVHTGRFVPPELTIGDDLGPRIRTTAEIISTFTHSTRGDLNHSIPLAAPLQLPEKYLIIDPYVFGLWVGDGDTHCAAITTEDPQVLDEIQNAGYTITKWADPRGNRYGITAGPAGVLSRQLIATGAMGTKQIPDDYLYGSEAQRRAFLQGLMDSDGYASGSHVEFCSTRGDHADAVMHLARSLGEKPRLSEGRATLRGRDCGAKYRVMWNPVGTCFRLDRKQGAIRTGTAQASRNHNRMIVDYEEIEPVQGMRCIEVDSPNHMYLVGRAFIPTHNTRAGAEYVIERARQGLGPIALIGETAADVRDVMVEIGDSSILKISPPGFRPSYEPSKRRLTWPNGVIATTYSGDSPDLLRGPQHATVWADEPAKWRYADEAWDMMEMGLRVGNDPRCVATTTPRPISLIKRLVEEAQKGTSVVITSGTTYENAANLSGRFRERVIERYEGTRLGRQELHAELLTDNPGALWTHDLIEETRTAGTHPALTRIVIGVDPSGGGDEIGIVAVGLGHDGHGYVIEDRTLSGSPKAWSTAVVGLYDKLGADRIVAERNYGGDMVESTIRTVRQNIPVTMVTASRGKQIRAEPVAALYEQKKIHHVGTLAKLEDEMTTWDPDVSDFSPNRLDALVWAVTNLMLGKQRKPDWSNAKPFSIGMK